MEGWLDKQSGGKLQKKGLGNTMAKWDRRFFVLRAGTSTLQYFKSERDASVGKKPAGELKCDGGEVKRETAGGNVFSISTAERVLTLRAESQQDVTDWTLAVVAAGGHTELGAFSAAGSQRDMTMSQVAAAEASKASPRGAPLSAAARDVASPAAERVAGGAAARRRRRAGGERRRRRAAGDGGVPDEAERREDDGQVDGGRDDAEMGPAVLQGGRRLVAARVLQIEGGVRGGKPPAEARRGGRDAQGGGGGGRAVRDAPRDADAHALDPSRRHPAARVVGRRAQGARPRRRRRAHRKESTDERRRRALAGGGGAAAAAGADAQRKILDRYKPIKVLLLGDAGVGKTCVLPRFADGTCDSAPRATVGMDRTRTTLDLDGTGEKVTLQIWDTAGQEMFRSIIASYYRGAHGVVLMYDVTRASSFDALHGWLAEVRAKCADDVVAVLVGNKVDCGTEGRQVDQAAAAAFAAEHGMPYVEVSAKAGVMVNEAFITLVATIAGRADELPTLIKRAKLAGPGSAAKADEARAEQNGTVSLTPQAPAPARKGAPQAGCAC